MRLNTSFQGYLFNSCYYISLDIMSKHCAISTIGPEEYKKMYNFNITYGEAETKFGKCFMGLHEDEICFLTFGELSRFEDLKKTFPRAQLTRDDEAVAENAEYIFSDTDNLKILLKGTDFQIKVWLELLDIQKGSTCCYEDVAKAVGNPKGVRAVANAIARNNVSYLVPCHRVISKDGSLNKYGGGVERKLQLLRYENAM